MHYLVAIGEVPTRELAIKEFEKLIDTFGFKYYCIFHEPKPIENPAQLIVAANWPETWIARYVEKKYIVIDPKPETGIAGLAEIEKFYVDLLYSLAGAQQRVA